MKGIVQCRKDENIEKKGFNEFMCETANQAQMLKKEREMHESSRMARTDEMSSAEEGPLINRRHCKIKIKRLLGSRTVL